MSNGEIQTDDIVHAALSEGKVLTSEGEIDN